MRPLITDGCLYIAQPPLYKAKKGNSETYLKDDDNLENYLIDSGISDSSYILSSGEAIASNDLIDLVDKSRNFKKVKSKENLLTNYEKILKIVSPILPHLANECLDELNIKERDQWPKVDGKFLKKESYNVVIQINGKKRDLMNFNKDINEKDLLLEIKNNVKINKFLKDKEIKKSIYIKNKLINLIV